MADVPQASRERRTFLVAACVGAAFLAAFVVALSPAVPRDAREALSGLGLMLAGLLGATSCAWRARRAEGRRGRSWWLLAVAGGVAVLGNVWVVVIGPAGPGEQPSVVADTAIALALTISILALLNFPTVRHRGFDLTVVVLDGVLVGLAVLLMASALVYPQLLDADGGGSDRFAVLAIPALDIALATVAVVLVLRSRGGERLTLGLVSLGFVMYATVDLGYAVMVAQDSFRFGTWWDLGWMAGYVLIGLAAWSPTADPTEIATAATSGSEVRDTLTVFAVLTIASVVHVATEAGAPLARTLLWLALLLTVGVRQTLLTVDNRRLRRGLEQRVAEQTADLYRMVRQNEVLLRSVGDGIYGVDRHGRITFVNPAGAEALGLATDQLLGRGAHDLFHAPAADGTPYATGGCYITEAIEQGLVVNAEEDTYLRSGGEAFPVEITASPLVDDDGRTGGAVVVFRDVTQRREVDRMKNEFLSVVSHELRTPLTSIRGSLGLLAGGAVGELPAAATRMTEIALRSTERLTRLINDILDLERLQDGTQAIDPSPWGARDLVTSALHELGGLLETAEAEIVVDVRDVEVCADRDRVIQTLTNLVGNALKFSDAPAMVRVEAHPAPAGDEVVFEVVDRGRGIPADQLESVFERFVQVDSSDARAKGGTGLGLAICRSIVERHGGRIWADSELGVGTTISFTLPAASPASGTDGADTADAADAAEPRPAELAR